MGLECFSLIEEEQWFV